MAMNNTHNWAKNTHTYIILTSPNKMHDNHDLMCSKCSTLLAIRKDFYIVQLINKVIITVLVYCMYNCSSQRRRNPVKLISAIIFYVDHYSILLPKPCFIVIHPTPISPREYDELLVKLFINTLEIFKMKIQEKEIENNFSQIYSID